MAIAISVAGRAAGLLDRLDQQGHGLFVGPEVRGEPALVADGGGQATIVQQSSSARGTHSTPHCSASLNDAAPTGMNMNSWKSTLLSACSPPLMTFIIGTGSTQALGPPT